MALTPDSPAPESGVERGHAEDARRPESAFEPGPFEGEGVAAADDRAGILGLRPPEETAPDKDGQTSDDLDPESHFVIAKGDRMVEPQSRRAAFERGLLWILAASLAAHVCVLSFLTWFGPKPLEAGRVKEMPVEVVVETPPPRPAENPAPAPPAPKAEPQARPEAKALAPEAEPQEAKPLEAKPEKAKAARSRVAEQKGAGRKPAEPKRGKPAPAQNETVRALAAKSAAAGQPEATHAAAQSSKFGIQSSTPGGVRLPFDNGPDIFRAVAVPLPIQGGDEPMSYKEIVFGLLERAKQYPQAARSRGAQGTAVVSFALDDAGELTDVSLVRSSGDADLDAESLALVGRAAPFPKPPPGAQRAFAAEITFGLQRAE